MQSSHFLLAVFERRLLLVCSTITNSRNQMITRGTAVLPHCVLWAFHFGVQGLAHIKASSGMYCATFRFCGQVGCSRSARITQQLTMPNSEQLFVSRCARTAAIRHVKCVMPVCTVAHAGGVDASTKMTVAFSLSCFSCFDQQLAVLRAAPLQLWCIVCIGTGSSVDLPMPCTTTDRKHAALPISKSPKRRVCRDSTRYPLREMPHSFHSQHTHSAARYSSV